MSNRTRLTGYFAAFGAKLVNRYWACSAIADDGALVFSLWSMFFEPSAEAPRRYKDDLKRWTRNPLGSQLARDHLTLAFRKKRPVRLVIAFSGNPEAVKKGATARGGNTWTVRKDLVGRVSPSMTTNSLSISSQRISSSYQETTNVCKPVSSEACV